jgi:hypothetical protein
MNKEEELSGLACHYFLFFKFLIERNLVHGCNVNNHSLEKWNNDDAKSIMKNISTKVGCNSPT